MPNEPPVAFVYDTVALVTVLFHASPSMHRSSIRTHGLIAHRRRTEAIWIRTRTGRQPRGNYGYEDLHAARAFASGGLHRRLGYDQVDIWKMDVAGLEVLFDPEIRLMQGTASGGSGVMLRMRPWARTPPRWYVPETVGPERLELVERHDWRWRPVEYSTRPAKKISLAAARASRLPAWPHD